MREVHPYVETHLTILNHRLSTQLSTCVGPLGYRLRLQVIHDRHHNLRQILGKISKFVCKPTITVFSFHYLPDFPRRALISPYDFPYCALGLEDTSPEVLFEAITSVDQSSFVKRQARKTSPSKPQLKLHVKLRRTKGRPATNDGIDIGQNSSPYGVISTDLNTRSTGSKARGSIPEYTTNIRGSALFSALLELSSPFPVGFMIDPLPAPRCIEVLRRLVGRPGTRRAVPRWVQVLPRRRGSQGAPRDSRVLEWHCLRVHLHDRPRFSTREHDVAPMYDILDSQGSPRTSTAVMRA